MWAFEEGAEGGEALGGAVNVGGGVGEEVDGFGGGGFFAGGGAFGGVGVG